MQISYKEYLGKFIKKDYLERYFKLNGNGYGEHQDFMEFIAYLYVVSGESEMRDKLKISDKRRELWFKRDIDLRLYIWIDEELKIKGIEPFKYQEIYAGHGRSEIIEMSLIQDEVKILKRFIDLIIYGQKN